MRALLFDIHSAWNWNPFIFVSSIIRSFVLMCFDAGGVRRRSSIEFMLYTTHFRDSLKCLTWWLLFAVIIMKHRHQHHTREGRLSKACKCQRAREWKEKMFKYRKFTVWVAMLKRRKGLTGINACFMPSWWGTPSIFNSNEMKTFNLRKFFYSIIYFCVFGLWTKSDR